MERQRLLELVEEEDEAGITSLHAVKLHYVEVHISVGGGLDNSSTHYLGINAWLRLVIEPANVTGNRIHIVAEIIEEIHINNEANVRYEVREVVLEDNKLGCREVEPKKAVLMRWELILRVKDAVLSEHDAISSQP